ncbi:MAG: hypothetical protein AAF292_16345 [Pseudomonadota bacterium]
MTRPSPQSISMEWWQMIALSREPDFLIGPAHDPYMRRWWLTPRNDTHNVYLHHFMHDDDDRALHDHPWESFSTLLSGILREVDDEHPEGTILEQGATRHRPADYAHRLEVIEPGFTLFVTGPKVREWGFHCPNGWVDWKSFCAVDENGKNTGQLGRGCGEMA